MKWQFEISDTPVNLALPITGYQIYSSGAKKGPYYYSMEDFLDAIKCQPDNEYDADGFRLNEKSSPVLPFGTIRYSVNETETRQRITMEIPQKQWDIRYGDSEDTFYNIGFPRMVLQFVLSTSVGATESKIVETRIYAVLNDANPITDQTSLYIFPYPNVGKSNGIVCWGSNQRLTIAQLVELERMFRWFVGAPFNEDHGVRTTIGIPRFKKLIEVIQDKPFDDEWLMPLNKTFGDLFEQ
ncbi:hypothetical protein [Sporosarcina sp. FSL K6-1508]|uniref:hypothetical protein n=1 Tax=Sporosarcina sp. FSL K6-1508 TaxID=2921553 RepID=UPI0030FC29B4